MCVYICTCQAHDPWAHHGNAGTWKACYSSWPEACSSSCSVCSHRSVSQGPCKKGKSQESLLHRLRLGRVSDARLSNGWKFIIHHIKSASISYQMLNLSRRLKACISSKFLTSLIGFGLCKTSSGSPMKGHATLFLSQLQVLVGSSLKNYPHVLA